VQAGGEFYYREYQSGGVTSLGLSDNTPEGKAQAEQIKNELF
jgi:hypothetical protein